MQRTLSARVIRQATAGVIESLESRRLLSVNIDGGVVTITGTHSNDVITISVDASDNTLYRINDNGNQQTVAIADVNEFQISGLLGNDMISVDETNGALIARRIIRGGGGNDTIIGGDGVDNVYGGGENDSIMGLGGDDSLRGGGGDDTIIGGAGNDWIVGLTGNDSLVGGAGDDMIIGSAGDDIIKGGAGNDLLYGHRGNDTLQGGAGDDVLAGDNENNLSLAVNGVPAVFSYADRLVGGPGNDTLLAHYGPDTLIGGDGGDLFDSRDSGAVLVDRNALQEARPAEDVFSENVEAEITVNVRGLIHGEEIAIPAGSGRISTTENNKAEAIDANGNFRLRDRIPRTDALGNPFTLGEVLQQWGVTVDGRHFGRKLGSVVVTINGSAIDVANVMQTPIHNSDQIVIQLGTPV